MIYRVVLKVGYYERWFEFEDPDEAMKFAVVALKHDTVSEDHKEASLFVNVTIVNKEAEAGEEE